MAKIEITIELNQEALDALGEVEKNYFMNKMTNEAEAMSKAFTKRATMIMFHLRHHNFGQKEKKNELESS